LLLIGIITGHAITAHGDGSSASNDGSTGAGAYSAGTQTAPAFGSDDQATPSVSAAAPMVTSAAAPGDTAVPSAPATATGPAATVLAAYADINQQDYQGAYSLGLGDPQPGESLRQYAAGYADTVSVAVTVTGVQGDTVDVSLDTTQSDGSQQTFAGTYTVSGGHITGASIQETS
jgi:hypothetical protein